MFAIVSANEKSCISLTECVCLSKITKIESYYDKVRITFDLVANRNNSNVELVANAINFASISALTIELEYKQLIALMP
jgi:hypothetical protein